VETVEHLDGNFSAFGRYCVVDRAQLLVALPGKINFPDRVAGVEVSAYYLICRSPYDLTCRSVSAR